MTYFYHYQVLYLKYVYGALCTVCPDLNKRSLLTDFSIKKTINFNNFYTVNIDSLTKYQIVESKFYEAVKFLVPILIDVHCIQFPS